MGDTFNEADKCGLQQHALGHGALNEPFVVRHMISGGEYDVPEETKKAFDLEAMMQNTDVTAQDTGSQDVNSKKAGIIGNTVAGDVIATVPDLVDGYAEAVKRNLALDNECHRLSWKILEYHGRYCKGISEIYYLLSRNDTEGATKSLDKFIDYLSEIEMEIHRFFDLVLFIQRTRQIIKGK